MYGGRITQATPVETDIDVVRKATFYVVLHTMRRYCEQRSVIRYI